MNTTAESSNSNSRVLIADDNSEFTHRASELLQNAHHYVVCEETTRAEHSKQHAASNLISFFWI